MTSEVALEASLTLINTLAKKYLNQDYFSYYGGAKDQLANLAVLNSFRLTDDLVLSKTDLTEIIESLERKKERANLCGYLEVCREAINSLREWPVIQGHVIQKHLLDLLSEELGVAIVNHNLGLELVDEIKAIENHIEVANLVNNFFKLLKNLNENELQDLKISQLLNAVDINRGLVVAPGELPRAILQLSKEIYSYLKLMPIAAQNDVGQSKKDKILLEMRTVIEPFQSISEAEKLPFKSLDCNKMNSLLKNFYARENYYQQLDTLVVDLKNCLEAKAWKNKAKNIFGAPQGVRLLRSIVNNQNCSSFEKLWLAYGYLEKKLNKKTTKGLFSAYARNLFTNFFYNNLYLNLKSLFKNMDLDNIAANNFSYWKSEDYSGLVEQVTKMRDKIQSTLYELQGKVQQPKLSVDRLDDRLAEELLFKNIRDLLINTSEIVNANEWNTEGRNLFFRGSKCPEGIEVIRKWTAQIAASPEHLTSFGKVTLLKKFIAIDSLLTQKLSVGKFKLYRQQKTNEAYQKFNEAYKSLYSFFSRSQRDTLDLIKNEMGLNTHADDVRMFEKLKWPSNVTVFNEAVIFERQQQEEFKKAVDALNTINPGHMPSQRETYRSRLSW